MFDTSVGRWTTTDPEGFKAGDTNLYRYCHNNPTNFTDPTGLWSAPAADKTETSFEDLFDGEQAKRWEAYHQKNAKSGPYADVRSRLDFVNRAMEERSRGSEDRELKQLTDPIHDQNQELRTEFNRQSLALPKLQSEALSTQLHVNGQQRREYLSRAQVTAPLYSGFYYGPEGRLRYGVRTYREYEDLINKKFTQSPSLNSDSWMHYSPYSPSRKIPERLVNKDAYRYGPSLWDLEKLARGLAEKSVGVYNGFPKSDSTEDLQKYLKGRREHKAKLYAKTDEILMSILSEVPYRRPETIDEYAAFYLSFDVPRLAAASRKRMEDQDKFMSTALTGLFAGPLGGMTTPVRTLFFLAADKGLEEAGVPGYVRFPLFVVASRFPARLGSAPGKGGERLVVGGGQKTGFPQLKEGDVALNINPSAKPHVVGDIRTVDPKTLGQFKEVYFERVPHDIIDIRAARNAAAVLQPGGRISIITGREANQAALKTALEQAGFTSVKLTTVGQGLSKQLEVTATLGGK